MREEPYMTVLPDTGCELARTCLGCRMPACKYADPHQVARAERERRNAEIRAAWERGLAIRQLVVRFGLSERTIFRVLAEGRAL